MPVNTFWGSERINHPASVHAWYRGPAGFNGSQCVEEWFSRYFLLLRERGFLGFYIYIFLYFFLLRERVFWVLFLCYEILLYIFPILPLQGLGFLKEWNLC